MSAPCVQFLTCDQIFAYQYYLTSAFALDCSEMNALELPTYNAIRHKLCYEELKKLNKNQLFELLNSSIAVLSLAEKTICTQSDALLKSSTSWLSNVK